MNHTNNLPSSSASGGLPEGAVYSEKLTIDNFFSIKHFVWDVKSFNVITGGMGVGKSLCMKLLYFFERTVDVSILANDIVNKDYYLGTGEIYKHINDKFNKIFNSFKRDSDFYDTVLQYTYTGNGKTFDLSARWDKKRKFIAWHSEYIEKNIEKWQSYLKENAADTLARGQKDIFTSISNDFNNSFPIASIFVPAARAVTAITNNDFPGDSLLNRFIRVFKKYALSNIQDEKDFDFDFMRILKIKKIQLPDSSVINDEDITFILPDGRKVSPFELSSGQQELLYFLMLIYLLPQTAFYYDNGSMTAFIEEPSAHLFPQEQKDTIENIVNVFRNISENNERNYRLFLSTHSPYVLNVINNMLKKGDILERNYKERDAINKAVAFPHLFSGEVSAYYITRDGTAQDLLDRKDPYLDDGEIAKISYTINNDTNKLIDLNNELLNKAENEVLSKKG